MDKILNICCRLHCLCCFMSRMSLEMSNQSNKRAPMSSHCLTRWPRSESPLFSLQQQRETLWLSTHAHGGESFCESCNGFSGSSEGFRIIANVTTLCANFPPTDGIVAFLCAAVLFHTYGHLTSFALLICKQIGLLDGWGDAFFQT